MCVCVCVCVCVCIQAGKSLIKSSSSLLTAAKSLVVNPNDPPMWQLLASHTKAVTDAIRSLLMAIRDKCPGQKECDDAIDHLNSTITQLDQAVLAAMSQQLQPHASSTLQVREGEREREGEGGRERFFVDAEVCLCCVI